MKQLTLKALAFFAVAGYVVWAAVHPDSLIARAKKLPYFHLDGYMNRWWLVPYKDRGSQTAINCGPVSWWRRPFARALQELGGSIRVHEILASDRDPDIHNHPWDYASMVLKGGYWELQPVFAWGTDEIIDYTDQWRGEGSFLERKAGSFHRLRLPSHGSPATTLFFTGEYKNAWGFKLADGTFAPWREYTSRAPHRDVGK